MKPAPTALPVRYRDRAVLVVDKPHGLPAQGTRDGGPDVFSLLQAAHGYVGLHHRLDTPASGLMVLTLTQAANAPLAAAFRERRVHREYLVVVVGDPGEAGAWDAVVDGKPARTRWQRAATGGGMAVLRCHLDTGRKHQIRVHAAGSGHGVVGDRRYGGAAGGLWRRLALHAWRLGFPHPVTTERIEVEAPLPADLRGLFARAGWAG
jgi:RluA family pseudouridine synthase